MSEFRVKKLEEIAEYKTGKLNSNAAVIDGEFPFFTCSRETFRTNTGSFDCECILLAGNNANAEYPIKYFSGGKFDAYQRTYVITPKDERNLNIRYLYYVLELKLNLLKSISTGVTTKFLTKTILDQLEIKLPSIEHQEKIVSVLAPIEMLIENNNRRISILEEMARLIYREWFVHHRYPGHENDKMVDSATEFGEVPEGWGVRKLEDFGRIETGKTPPKKDPDNYGDYMPFIKTPDMHDQFFVISTTDNLSEIGAKSQKKKTLPPNSICVSCIGTAGVIALTSVPSQTNQQINSIILDKESTREYLYYAIKDLCPLMEKIGSTGATMTNVSKGKFQALEVIWPREELIDKYHKKVAKMFDRIKVLQKQNLKLKATRDLLLPRLISGNLEV